MLRRTIQALSFVLLSLILPVAAAAQATAPAGDVKKTAPGEAKKTPAPRIHTSLNPPDGSLINNAKPTIAAEYLDEGIGINPAGTRIYLNGVDVSNQAQATPNKVAYTPSQPLNDGLHKVRVEIDDKAGNPATVTWSFTLHTKPPTVKITSHGQNQYVNQSPVMVTGTVDDVRARVLVNGIAASVEKGLFSARVNIIEGSNTITVVATDPFANNGSDSVIVVLDSKPPTIEITSPHSNSSVNSRTVAVAGIADSKAASVTVSVSTGANSTPADLAPGTFTARTVTLAEGVNTITAKAVSRAGNVSASSVRVTVDTVAPRIQLTSPRDQTLTNKKMITVTGTVDDPLALVKVNNTPVQVSKGTFALSGVNLVEGSNTITATAADRAGNQAQAANLIVVLKTIPPAPPKLSDLPFVTRDAAVLVAGTAEPGTQVELFVNSATRGTVKADEKGNFTFKVTLAEGNNAFSAMTSDAVGNVSASSAVVNVFLDTTPPRIL